MKRLPVNLALCALLFTMSCKKESVISNSSAIATATDDASAGCSKGTWIGRYVNADDTTQQTTGISTATFVQSGVAQMKSSPYANYYSYIELDVPPCHSFFGDSSVFQFNMENWNQSSLYGTGLADYDVIITIYGEKNTAYAHVKHSDYIGTGQGIGSLNFKNRPELLMTFSDFTSGTMIFKDRTMQFTDGFHAYPIVPYKVSNSLGAIRKISIGFKGGGCCNFVSITNSYTQAMIMLEGFNFAGESHVQWN